MVLGAISFLTVARRSDVRGAGALSRETKRRDRDAEIDLPAGPTGREVERAAVAEQRGGLVKAESMAPAVFVPPDPEAVGVSRRQFFNRATVGLMGAGLTSFAAAGFVAFLWPIASGGFGGKVNVGKRDEIIGSIRSSGGFFYAAEARAWLTEYPSAAMPKAEAVVPGRRRVARAGPHRDLPEVPPPRLPRAQLHQQPVVRVPVSRFAVQPGGREEGRSRPSRDGPLRLHGLGRWRRRRRHRDHLPGRADRHEHHRSGSGRAALHMTPVSPVPSMLSPHTEGE
ncbi:MAG: hypothetical protein R2713_22085 [Ilumatobacteraceae bacterium]